MRFSPISRRHFVQGSAALGALALTRPSRALAASKTVFRHRIFTDIQVLDPPFRLTKVEEELSIALFHRLIAFKPGTRWEWEPYAAESIEQVDDTHIAFTLRPGILWSNGFGELTAEDVKYSFERVIDPALDAPYKDDWAALDHVEVTGKYSGVIVLKEYFAPLWWSTLPWGTSSIVCKKAVEAVGGRFTTEPPATSGPYRIKEWIPKQRLVLARNPDWSGSESLFEEIHVLPIEDEKAAELAFEAGELDYTTVGLSSLASYQTRLPAGAKLIEKPSLAYTWLGMNTENPALQDIRVRRAIQKAIDVDMIIEAAYFGTVPRSTGIIAPGLLGHRDIEPPKRDLEGAKRLLAEAGVSGLTLTLDVLNTTEYLTAAQVVQANLAELGITVAIKSHDGGTFWTLGDQSAGDSWKNVQLIINYFTMAPDPSWATAWFTCHQVGVWNWERWCNEEFTELHKRGLVERDDAERDKLYRRMQDLMEESGAYVFITHGVNAAIYRDTIVPATLPDGTVRLDLFRPA
jgi:peptide/nickel transport system substrate-binding protein